MNRLLLLGAVALATYAVGWASPYNLRVLTVAGTYALAAIGFQVVFGRAGALSLAHGTFYGLGAYVTGILGSRYGLSFPVTFPLALLVPAILALVVAAPVLRLESHYFALATLGIAQVVVLAVVNLPELTGGANGLSGVPGIGWAGWTVPRGLPLAAFVWGLVVIGAVLAWRLEQGRRGRAFDAMADSPMVARALGLDVGRLRLEAFMVSALFAGAAGALAAHTQRVVSPEVLEFPVMVSVLSMVVVGGRHRVAGAVVGALLLTHVPEWFRFLERSYLVVYGGVLLAAVVAAPEGVVGAVERWFGGRRPRVPAFSGKVTAGRGEGGTLELGGLSKSFGGVRALDGVSFTLEPGRITGLIGPNGSGKTTLINLVTGLERPDAGAVLLEGRDVTGWRADRLARAGIARTFQAVGLPAQATVLEAVAAARLTLDRSTAAAEAHALHFLDLMGAAEVAGRACGDLSPGVQRRVEVARALARAPRLLLLDEPAAGLSEAEQSDLGGRLRDVVDRSGLTVLVVEHTMAFLMPLADRLICLDEGRVLADGPTAAVREEPSVVAAYLGGAP